MTSLRRIRKEFEDATREGFSVSTIGDDFYNWQFAIEGPEDTPYAGGVFFLRAQFPNDYPFKPPKVVFETKIYHCSVNEEGRICVMPDILSVDWSPAITMSKVIPRIVQLLREPHPDDPWRPEIAVLYKNNRELHDQNAREWTRKFAM
eukprot:TRINITY_DN10048_c0_g1_i2.p1 TRINITY_DN10048_c0_g1~~TRINITY_DN10048_c0_g1_i2.p1  ORF type:complete len:172 (-),score=32.36 TRINITY_DN10048_c0_g1_i2:68-511(-)